MPTHHILIVAASPLSRFLRLITHLYSVICILCAVSSSACIRCICTNLSLGIWTKSLCVVALGGEPWNIFLVRQAWCDLNVQASRFQYRDIVTACSVAPSAVKQMRNAPPTTHDMQIARLTLSAERSFHVYHGKTVHTVSRYIGSEVISSSQDLHSKLTTKSLPLSIR